MSFLPSKDTKKRLTPMRLAKQDIANAAVHESAFGTKQTSDEYQSMSAFGGRADMVMNGPHVRF
jgi:hypothetical protein